MKNKLSKGIITFVILLSNVVLVAQTGPSAEDNIANGNLESANDPLPVSIDSNFYLLLILAFVLGLYYTIRINKSKVVS